MRNIVILYDSKTGNVERFINKLREKRKWKYIKLEENLIVEEEYHLITFTTNFGKVPDTTSQFLEKNNKYIKSVSSSGNMNWGKLYGVAADEIKDRYNVPILTKFELSGTQKTVDEVIEKLEGYYNVS